MTETALNEFLEHMLDKLREVGLSYTLADISAWSIVMNVIRIYSNVGIIESRPPQGAVTRVEIRTKFGPPSNIVLDGFELKVDGVSCGKLSYQPDLTEIYAAWMLKDDERRKLEQMLIQRRAVMVPVLQGMGITNKKEANEKLDRAIAACNGDYSVQTLLKLAFYEETKAS